jgi:ubiquitin C-terminal hydrolase
VCRTDNDTDVVCSMARQLVSLATDSNLNVMASLQACFLQSEAREKILIEEAWDCDTGSGEEGPC